MGTNAFLAVSSCHTYQSTSPYLAHDRLKGSHLVIIPLLAAFPRFQGGSSSNCPAIGPPVPPHIMVP